MTPEELHSPAAAPRRPLDQRIALAAIAALLTGAAVLAIVVAVKPVLRSTAAPAAPPIPAAATSTPAAPAEPTSAPRTSYSVGTYSPGPRVATATGSPKPPDTTCSDLAAWEQQGGTELLDGLINNQDSGNINVEEMKTNCPKYVPLWQKAQNGIPGGGAFAVPADVKPGTYETTSSDIEDCYWERSRNGNTVDNRFITASKVKIRVTIRSTDDTFVTRDCGNWIKVG